jgi:hypothetical protein
MKSWSAMALRLVGRLLYLGGVVSTAVQSAVMPWQFNNTDRGQDFSDPWPAPSFRRGVEIRRGSPSRIVVSFRNNGLHAIDVVAPNSGDGKPLCRMEFRVWPLPLFSPVLGRI